MLWNGGGGGTTGGGWREGCGRSWRSRDQEGGDGRFKTARSPLVGGGGDPCVPEEGNFFCWRVQPAPPPLLEITGSETLGKLWRSRVSLPVGRMGPFVGQDQGPPDHEKGQSLGSWAHPEISRCWGNGEKALQV